MKSLLQGLLLFLFLFTVAAVMYVPAQELENSDWESIWVNRPPIGQPDDPNYWMVGKRQLTGMAYDRWRDVLYLVNPYIYDDGSSAFPMPRIFIWDAMTGQMKYSINAGQLNVPVSTVYGSLSQGQYPLYKIDLDDEGRIFANNLVAPVFGICPPDANPPVDCVPGGKYWYLVNQGPLKVYRWDTPTSNPVLVYATLNAAHTAVGSPGNPPNSEQIWTRWGDALDVVGHRGILIVNGVPTTVDSARIYTSGGRAVGIIEPNREINVLLEDSRSNRPNPFRLASRLSSNNAGFASHGVAVTGSWPNADIYSEGNLFPVTRSTQPWSNLPQNQWPEYHAISNSVALNNDYITGTGDSGPVAYFTVPGDGRKFLICADAYPSNNNQFPQDRTQARVMDVTNPQSAFRVPEFPSSTPLIGNSPLDIVTGISEYITDVDYKIDIDQNTGHPHLIVFLMMTGTENGVAAFRSKNPVTVPVELTTFKAVLNGSAVDLTWSVTSELNNHGFDIQRSFDNGSTWETVGFVAGRGTTSEPKAYSYSDPLTTIHSSVGVIRYRLRQVDVDGRSSLSPDATVMLHGGASAFELGQNFPNPFNPSTTISYQLSKPGFVTLRVFNAVGDEVATLVNGMVDSGTHLVDFNAEALPSGTYMYQINVEGSIQQKKMVVMK